MIFRFFQVFIHCDEPGCPAAVSGADTLAEHYACEDAYSKARMSDWQIISSKLTMDQVCGLEDTPPAKHYCPQHRKEAES